MTVKVEIRNCNNIDVGKIEIRENVLNIKYGINGTGKSTIAKGIVLAVNDKKKASNTITELTPFKHFGLGEDGAIPDLAKPEVTGVDEIINIKVFDEKYISDFVFQADELIKGSFDVFIRDDDYEKGMKEIDSRVEKINDLLSEDKDIKGLIDDFNEISNSFGKTTKTGIHGSSNLAKSLKDGNKVLNIPVGLEGYKSYIQHPDNYKWIKWQQDGKSFVDISTDCPYCVSDIKTKKETIQLVSQVYEPKAIENLNKIVAVFQRLNQYFSDDTKLVIDKFVTNVEGYTDDQVEYLRCVREQIERLSEKFVKAQNLGFLSLKDVDKVIEELKKYKIDIDLFPHLKSVSTVSKVDIVNKAIDGLLKEAGELHGSIVKQKILIQRLVKENSSEINAFLKNAGYHYKVTLLEDKGGEYKLKLIHNDVTDEVTNVKNHLSFGERNAFSLVLFMYEALKSSPDLVVLDDPISSFDKNKKYAIIDMLFRKEKSFRGKTVLLLTHDFEPVVDMVYLHTDRFIRPFATFLENKKGQLAEKEILKSNVKTFVEINLDNLQLDIHDINKLVYLRRHHEVMSKKDLDYDVLSNLFHKREKLTIQDRDMTNDEIEKGSELIKKVIPSFDYSKLLDLLKNDDEMKKLYLASANNYEKLHIYRIIFDDKDSDDIESDIILKFINEAFHIENNFIYQLNPSDYQLVPQYVIDECDKYIAKLNT